ncbi:MAG: methyltransferase domain-containing protein [Rhodospirillaceae bacterium]|nr:methyltransferase domain-containing protein [Rhodospirillaceae bacterium]
MTAISESSGNPTADKRFELAQMFIERRDLEAAADLMRQALELAPEWAECRFTLAETLMLMGHKDEAITAFQAYLRLDPADSMGAHAKLVILGAAPSTAELPPAYVERLFDQYATGFEKALTERLRYTAPQQLRESIKARRGKTPLARALDLGCGTGLMGAALHGMVGSLDGVDLSAPMLAEARRKNIYANLIHGDMRTAMAGKLTHYDLIVAADVFVYVGDIAPIIIAAFEALTPGGLLAFTVQALSGDGYGLGEDQRFSHSEAYLNSVLAAFCNVEITPGSFRRDRARDVPGFLVLAETPA